MILKNSNFILFLTKSINNIFMNTNTTKTEFIGERITKARENLRITRFEVADSMCLSKSIIGKWERGESNPSIAHLIKLAEVLGVSFEWLATGKENQTLDNEVLDETMQNIKINEILSNFNKQQKHHLLNFLDLVR